MSLPRLFNPWLVSALGDPEPIRMVRRRMLPLAQGKVLEIGAGTGANFPYYDAAKVSRLYALEPNPAMIRVAERRLSETGFEIVFLAAPAESIPLPDCAVDTAVSTFTLCLVPGIREALDGIARVLRPGGRLLFLEHGPSPDRRVRRWQKVAEPLHRWLFAGLMVTRDIPAAISGAGLRIKQIDSAYLGPFPKSLTYCCWGVAIRP